MAEARKGPAASREFDLLIHRARIDIVPCDASLVEEAQSSAVQGEDFVSAKAVPAV